MRTAFPTLLALLTFLAASPPAGAQFLPPSIPSRELRTAPAPDIDRDQNTAGAVLGAAIGAAAGGAVALMVAWDLWEATNSRSTPCERKVCGFLGGALLGWVGEAVGLGVGAHLGNGRRGNVIAPLAASMVVLLAAGIAGDNGRLPERSQWVVPVAQIVAAVAAEITVGRDRAGR